MPIDVSASHTVTNHSTHDSVSFGGHNHGHSVSGQVNSYNGHPTSYQFHADQNIGSHCQVGGSVGGNFGGHPSMAQGTIRCSW